MKKQNQIDLGVSPGEEGESNRLNLGSERSGLQEHVLSGNEIAAVAQKCLEIARPRSATTWTAFEPDEELGCRRAGHLRRHKPRSQQTLRHVLEAHGQTGDHARQRRAEEMIGSIGCAEN